MWTAARRVLPGRPGWRAVFVAVMTTLSLGTLPPGPTEVDAARTDSEDKLHRAFLRAVEAIRRNQQPEGSWVTISTPRPVFEPVFSPHVNVFVPSLIVDLLEPIAKDTGLTDVVERGRHFLREQLEETGLARYMGKRGRPGQPGVAAPGCETPADADDTALIWRLAPGPDPAALQSARQVLQRYRTPDGLYRTWLADEAAYRCFHTKYRGRERNPADVGIQMHLYQFFARYDREAAQRLCAALRPRMSDDRIWVWYTVAPLVPLVRRAELARDGCMLDIPEERLGRAARGQESYLGLGRRLAELLGKGKPRGTIGSLSVFAADGLARIERRPPLLYHNDLSWPPAETGYYWSADVGYALWLRTYVELARREPSRLSLPRLPARRT